MTETAGRVAARCECYKGHASASGRCTTRPAVDPRPKTETDSAAICDACRAECEPFAHTLRDRNGRITGRHAGTFAACDICHDVATINKLAADVTKRKTRRTYCDGNYCDCEGHS